MLFLTSCKQMHVASEKLHKEQDGTLILQFWSYYGQVMASISISVMFYTNDFSTHSYVRFLQTR